MNKPTNFQTILGADGRPAFVVVPYDEFLKAFEQSGELVPDAVVRLAFDGEMSPAKAWRTHLELTQAEVASRMGITQGAYAQLEASQNLRKSSREKIAAALGITPGQLDF
ncbi:transcriptional regulator [Comamonas serinivorans]|uniref:Transcriptional regulator n=1 Tax=Comamonas serinivorans TaxID=1082851 RepID=A0A1Y0EM70_9BURK|nr:helix-turn-helix transcriptional regulator [Comamonas serinivorans]ARU04743.1 transcriptional regulator [Comamonas serinivorans]